MDATMLIIDDSEINREILSLLFRDTYMLLEAENGTEAMEILESCKGKIDIVLLDLIMPDMNGLTILDRRRRLDYFSSVPVIVITSSNNMEDQVRAFELGASDYINKPFVPEIVRSRVNNVMSAHQKMMSMEMEAEKLKVKAELDQMTGLINKTTTEYAIASCLAQQPQRIHALLIIDIDNFKQVNDTAGHQMGDKTICMVAKLIYKLFRKTDIVGRIGGDEFTVLMVDVPSIKIVREKVEELLQRVCCQTSQDSTVSTVTLSIGVASTKGCVMGYDELFRQADEALYEAKRNGRNRAHEYGREKEVPAVDTRRSVLLLSSNRSICSMIYALMPNEFRMIEAISVQGLSTLSEAEQKGLWMVYVDASDLVASSAQFWEKLREYLWLRKLPIVAICEEGNLRQYQDAITAGVVDILSTPLEGAAFKRRIECHIKRLKEINQQA